LQIDFGERRVMISDETARVYLSVATLGYSRRLYVRAFRNERQESWFADIEGAFRHFGGIAKEMLLDNDRGLVARHDRATREVEFNARLRAFAKHWGFRPHACAPYRARTKGKDERGVAYVKKNAIAGRRFESWSALGAHPEGWVRDVADQCVHGTTGEVPILRSQRCRRMEIGKRSDNIKRLVVLPPRRWVVECTFSWFGRNRHLAKDFENLAETLAAFVTIASIQLALRRLARA
jgi:transposase